MSRRRRPDRPPRLPEWLLERVLPAGRTRESVLGDLAEEWHTARSGTAWYWRRAAALGGSFLWQRLNGTARVPQNSTRRRRTPRKGDGPMQAIARDLRYAFRTLVHKPGFAAAAVVTVTLGIGVNTTIFSLVNGILLRQPPGIERAAELVQIGRGAKADDFDNFSFPVYREIRDRNDLFSSVAAFARRGAILGRGDATEIVATQIVSGNYFDVLGVRPVLGRGFLPEETSAPGNAYVAVISERLWKRRYGGDPEILSRGITVNSRPFQVVGVVPARFAGTDVVQRPPELWVPVTACDPLVGNLARRLSENDWSWLWVVARRRPGVEVGQAAAGMTALVAQIDGEYPGLAKQGIQVARGAGINPSARTEAMGVVLLLSVVAALVLAIACANLANLLLVRATARAHEIHVRLTLGARRGRIVRQLLVENLVLSTLGAAVAFALTFASARAIPRLIPYPLAVDLTPDLRVFAFALAVAVIAGLVFGLAPAWRSARQELAPLRGATSTPGVRGSRLRHGLVVCQIALAFVLLVAAGLLARSARNVQVTDPGFHTDDVLVLSLPLELRGIYREESGSAWYDELLGRVRALPGVAAAALGESLPIADFPSNRTLRIDGHKAAPGGPPYHAYYNVVSADYFATLGLTVARGRSFDAAVDTRGSTPVVVINETMARRFWPGEDPIGRRVGYGEREAEVVGVIRDARVRSLRGPIRPYMYLPLAQTYSGRMVLHVRTVGDPWAAAPAVRRQIAALDPGLPVYRVGTLRAEVTEALGETRATATLIGTFGILAVALAALGLYGVVAFSVAERTREMGIRMALGAGPADVLREVLGGGLRMTALGVGVGIAGALAATKWIAGWLYGVSPTDASTLIAIGLAFTVVGLVASYVPARRATSVDPVAALRDP